MPREEKEEEKYRVSDRFRLLTCLRLKLFHIQLQRVHGMQQFQNPSLNGLIFGRCLCGFVECYLNVTCSVFIRSNVIWLVFLGTSDRSVAGNEACWTSGHVEVQPVSKNSELTLERPSSAKPWLPTLGLH